MVHIAQQRPDIFLFSRVFRLTMGFTQLSAQWVLETPCGDGRRVWSCLLSST